MGLIVLLMLIPVHLVWYFERHNPELISNSAYLPGIFEALWWTLLTLVGQAEEMPKAAIGRVVALFWVVVGIVFVTYFTAIITADITVEELRGNVQGLGDLQSDRVALIADEGAIVYLQQHHVKQIESFSDPEQAYRALLSGEVKALIAPRPLLLHLALQQDGSRVQIVGAPFRNQLYAIALPRESPLRRPINQAILTLKENGTYDRIHQKWFGLSSQD